MKLLLLCLGLTLVCAQEGNSGVVRSNFDIPELILFYRVNGVCTELPLTCDSTGEDGVYTVSYDGENKFRILQVNYSQHIIFYLENFSDSFKLLELYAREPDTSPELKNEFVEICQKYGVVKENVIDLTKVDRCLHARGNGVAYDCSLCHIIWSSRIFSSMVPTSSYAKCWGLTSTTIAREGTVSASSGYSLII
ncbi:TPA: Equ c1 isoform 1-like protein [Bos taurus]|nr:TPA: Equ c1 isoform 1-like protein [Bos taurus]